MITESTVYWVTRCDYIHHVFAILSVLAGVALLMSLIVIAISFNNEETYPSRASEYKQFRKDTRKVIGFIIMPLFFLFIAGVTFVPTTKEMATILVLPRIANSELIQKEIPNEVKDLYKMAKQYLVEQTKGATNR